MEVSEQSKGTTLRIVAPEFDATFEIWGSCPVQAIGTVLGRDLYFRARSGEWSFEVANSDNNLPSDGFPVEDGCYRTAKYPGADWMPLREALKIITKCPRDFTDPATQR